MKGLRRQSGSKAGRTFSFFGYSLAVANPTRQGINLTLRPSHIHSTVFMDHLLCARDRAGHFPHVGASSQTTRPSLPCHPCHSCSPLTRVSIPPCTHPQTLPSHPGPWLGDKDRESERWPQPRTSPQPQSRLVPSEPHSARLRQKMARTGLGEVLGKFPEFLTQLLVFHGCSGPRRAGRHL